MTDDLKPCPFCTSTNLRELDITLCDDDGERDVLAIECLCCDAQAPKAVWNCRGGIPWQQQLGDGVEDVDVGAKL